MIAITDHPVSPLARAADVTLEIGDDPAVQFRSLVAPLCVAQALVMAVGYAQTRSGRHPPRQKRRGKVHCSRRLNRIIIRKIDAERIAARTGTSSIARRGLTHRSFQRACALPSWERCDLRYAFPSAGRSQGERSDRDRRGVGGARRGARMQTR